MTTNWNKIPRQYTEGLKELARIVLIAVFPVILLGLNPVNGTVTIKWNVVGVVALVAVIKSFDKYVHVWGKENNNESAELGLTRF